ncbi:alpha/beta fold hydrolase [Angustibacter aerolatus]
MSEVLAHDVDGEADGPRVLLLHTGATHRAMWDPQWPTLLSHGFRVARCDLRGYAGDPPSGRVDQVADLEALLAHLDWRDVAVVGPSYGGYVALSLAAASERVGRLLLIDPATTTLQPCERLRALWTAERAALAAGDVDAAVRANADTWVGPEATPAGRAAFTTQQRAVFEVQLATPDDVEEVEHEPDAATVEVPTTVVVGLHDLPSFVDAARELAVALPHGTLVELAWAGHVPSIEDPERFEPVLLDALRRNGSGG